MSTSYDVIVVGAGIHGVGVAQAATAAGYKVLVLEQNGIGSGTSSRSSKLIHGGLRYLESYQFSLVRECLHERDLLLRLAPDLIKLQPFYIPIYQNTTRSPLKLRAGLSVYAALGGFRKTSLFKSVQHDSWKMLDGLSTDELKHVFVYKDAQTDDKSLTRAVMLSAQSLGATLVMPAKLTYAKLHKNGVEVTYEKSSGRQTQTVQCTASVLINAAGPWVNDVLNLVSPDIKKMPIELVQGSHIIFDGKVEKGIYYLESPSDKRAIFVMPWYDRVMAGTTETLFQGEPSQVQPLSEECRYLLEVVQHYFPKFNHVTVNDLDAFAGLRVLPSSEANPFNRHRDTILWKDNEYKPRCLSIYGGKLTAYRTTANNVMRQLRASLPGRDRRADTAELMLYPAD